MLLCIFPRDQYINGTYIFDLVVYLVIDNFNADSIVLLTKRELAGVIWHQEAQKNDQKKQVRASFNSVQKITKLNTVNFVI